MFDQPPGHENFRPTQELLQLLQVVPRKTLTEVDEKDELLRLQLEPESKIPTMMVGLQQVMAYSNCPGILRDLHSTIPSKLYVTTLGSSVLPQNIRVGLTVFKGEEIPLDLFVKVTEKIESDDCTVIIIIEDASKRHDSPGSNFEHFRSSYSGDIDVEKRLIFVNGTDAEGQSFDEDFFVRLVSVNILEDEAKELFNRLQIGRRLELVAKDCVYCPSLDERILIEEFFRQDRSFKIGEIKALNASYYWVDAERLKKLAPYLPKTGATYSAGAVENVAIFKFILGTLQSCETGLTLPEIETRIAARFIRTGATASVQSYAKWALTLLVDLGKVDQVDGRYTFKDLDRELIKLDRSYRETLETLRDEISTYDTAQIDEPTLKEIREKIDRIEDRINEVSRGGVAVAMRVVEYDNSLVELKALQEQLKETLGQARESLRDQLKETQKQFQLLKEDASWPFQEMQNPYESLYGLEEIGKDLEGINKEIQGAVPQQKRCRQKIEAINKQLEALRQLLGEEIKTGCYEGKRYVVDSCVFSIFNAIRDSRPGKVTLYLS